MGPVPVRLTMHGPMKAWFAAKQKKKNCAEKAFKKYVGSQILWRILQPFTIEDCTDNSIFSTQDMQCCWLFKNAKTSHILGWKYRIIQKICYTAVVQSCNIRPYSSYTLHMAIRVYNRTLHIGIQPYSSYGHNMGIPPYSSYEHTAVLFIPVWAMPYNIFIMSFVQQSGL